MSDCCCIKVPLQHQRPEQIDGLCFTNYLRNVELVWHFAVPNQNVMQSLLLEAPLHEAEHIPKPAFNTLNAPQRGLFTQQQVQQSSLKVIVSQSTFSCEPCLLSV